MARDLLVDEPAAKAAAVAATVLEARAATMREVIVLPKYLIEQGERAAEIVAALEKEA